MFCPKCGTKNVDEARFCVACGNPLPAVSVTPSPSGEIGNPAIASDMAPGVVPTQQSVAPESVKMPIAKKKAPIFICIAAVIVAFVLNIVFFVMPVTNKDSFKGVQEGDVVKFGSYEQDGNVSNGEEPIEWRVLEVEGDRAYVVSEKGLDAHAFNEDVDDGNDWNSSDLKAWLEEDFASQAFTDDEMNEIDGAPTLLSVDEARSYFGDYGMCEPTQQAVNNGVNKDEDNGACHWWLRSPGGDLYHAAGVNEDGYVYSDGYVVDFTDFAVRPALWVSVV